MHRRVMDEHPFIQDKGAEHVSTSRRPFAGRDPTANR